MKFSPEMRRGRGSKLREWFKFVRGGILGQSGEMGCVFTIQGKMLKSSLQSPGKLSIFPL